MPSDNRSLFIHFNVKTIHSVLNLSERVKIHSYKWSCPFKMLLSGHTITYKVFFLEYKQVKGDSQHSHDGECFWAFTSHPVEKLH